MKFLCNFQPTLSVCFTITNRIYCMSSIWYKPIKQPTAVYVTLGYCPLCYALMVLTVFPLHYQWLLYTVLASDSSARYHHDQEWSIKCIVFNGIIQSSVVGVRHNTVLEWPMFLSRHIKNIDFDIHSWVNSLLREGHLWSWNY